MNISQPRYDKIFMGDKAKAKEAVAVWKEVVSDLEARGMVTETRLKIADRYARASAEYTVLYPVTASEGATKVGPNGGDFVNLNWSIIEKLNDRMAKFEDQLRLDLRHSDVWKRPSLSKPTPADEYLD